VAQGVAKSKHQDTLADILQAPDRDELLHWLRHRSLLHHDASLGYTLIHAGLPPQWDVATAQQCAREVEAVLRDSQHSVKFFQHMYGDHPDRWSPQLSGFDRLRFITNCLTRLRFCREDGRIALAYKGTLEKAPAGLLPWFQAPDRRSRTVRVVFGHWSALGFHKADGVLGLDTGCVWGSQLTAVRLDTPTESLPVCVECSSSGLTVEE
jgi:bis(5'-nucleosyl)-tetraphosphatase (symmetrical)